MTSRSRTPSQGTAPSAGRAIPGTGDAGNSTGPGAGRGRAARLASAPVAASGERDPLTLVLGATGKTGRRVAERLAARGLPVRPGSRGGAPRFHWGEPETWEPALDGVGAVYVSYYPDLAVAGAADAVAAFAELAVRCGARRLVLLSGRGEEGAQLGEQALRASGAEWTIVRSSWFDQNFSESYLRALVAGGVVALPARQVGEPFVDAGDVADVAVAALTGRGHAGRVYEVTGPRLLTFAEAVEELAEAAGRRIRYVRISLSEYAALLAEHDLPPGFASLLPYLFVEVLDGRNAHLTDGVRRALGREPTDFAEYARTAAATGVWGAPASARRPLDGCGERR